ncbi:hypothetical protein G9A89_008271 [Geosiphon pyriformis]|nr:hypothetical protein G9A89_008271 [Geosiphon pyriformis]
MTFNTQIGNLGFCQLVNNEATTTTEEKKNGIFGVIPYIPPEDVNPENRPTAEEVDEMLEELADSEFESEFLESEKYVKEILKNDPTTPMCIHPGAVYTSRLLTLQTIKETKG